MEMKENRKAKRDEAMLQAGVKPVGAQQLRKFTMILKKYKSARNQTERRVIASENWWKLRNTVEEQKGGCDRFHSTSGWLHNVIVSKHADAMEAYPEPNILPREAADRQEARVLSQIVPCVLEQNRFENTYSDVMWQKLKTGTGVYKVMWDTSKLNGLGDIGIERVNLLDLYWEPGITNIQQSRYVFHTELAEKELLEEQYPQLKGKIKSTAFLSAKFLYDDRVDMADKTTVIDVYYHKYVNGRKTLQYCKYVGETVLYATENEDEMAQRGLYDHGKFPYVFDALFPIEGSPCGYGFVDLCRSPQTDIDMLKTAFLKNAMVGATPRYFSKLDGKINEEEFLDLENAFVHVNGNLDETYIRKIDYHSLDGNYISLMDRSIQELRETSGNTEASTGATPSGVTAASAIAALQEASGKGSRDSTRSAYRSFTEIVELCIELIRQFYDLPRQFRVIGRFGSQQFISYDNSGLQPVNMGDDFGTEVGYRLPVFDIKISAQKKSVYTKVSQNELALQLYQMQFFNPQNADQALAVLDMMDFDGKEDVAQKINTNSTMQQRLIDYMKLSLLLAKKAAPEMVQGLSADIMQMMGANVSAPMNAAAAALPESDNIAGLKTREHGVVESARERAGEAIQPKGGKVIEGKK